MHWKTMFDRYYCIKLKTFAIFRVISCTILFRLFTDVSRTQFPRTMLVLGPGSTHLVTAANLWPRYDHIESCVAVNCLVNTRLSPVNARLLIMCDTASKLHVVNSRALTGEKPCINKAIQALLMHGYATLNMIVPGPQICCRYEMCTARLYGFSKH